MKTPRSKYRHIVVDMCSECRRGVGSLNRPISAKSLASIILRQLKNKYNGKGILALIFDCSSRMHEGRALLHQKRYKKLTKEKEQEAIKKGKLIVDGHAYHPSLCPIDRIELEKITIDTKIVWNRLWSSKCAKGKAWDMLYESILWAQSKYGSDNERIFLWKDDDPVLWPQNDMFLNHISPQISANRFGEADQRVMEAVVSLPVTKEGVLLRSVDTDLVAQTLCCWPSCGSFDVEFKKECVNMGQFVQQYQSNPQSCMNAAFWIIVSGGCDYCDGFTPFGYLIRDLASYILDPSEQAQEVVRICVSPANGRPCRLLFNIGAVGKNLLRLKRRQKNNATVKEFERELNLVMFCMALFAGFKKNTGGPRIPSILFSQIESDVFDEMYLELLSSQQKIVAIDYDSEYSAE